MNEIPDKGLLPAGLRDVLPPDAACEAQVADTLMACFAGHGFERVDPPLIEFEESLFSGGGAMTAADTLRLMDPVSQHMMGVRADMTVQVARIATTRLQKAPRPLRLCYTGQVLRVRGTQLRPERQFRQTGVELIGTDVPAADVEVILLAVEALSRIGVCDLSVDINMPTLVPAVFSALGLDETLQETLRAALDRKDASAVAAAGGKAAGILKQLLSAVGEADEAISILENLDLPGNSGAQRDHLLETIAKVKDASPGISLTIDPVESRGFEYHCGVTFSLFARGVRGELGRGGRYRAGNGGRLSGLEEDITGEDLSPGEAATGFTIFVNTLLGVLPAPEAPKRVFVPLGTSRQDAGSLREEGWVVVSGLEEVADLKAEAKRLACTAVFVDGKVKTI